MILLSGGRVAMRRSVTDAQFQFGALTMAAGNPLHCLSVRGWGTDAQPIQRLLSWMQDLLRPLLAPEATDA